MKKVMIENACDHYLKITICFANFPIGFLHTWINHVSATLPLLSDQATEEKSCNLQIHSVLQFMIYKLQLNFHTCWPITLVFCQPSFLLLINTNGKFHPTPFLNIIRKAPRNSWEISEWYRGIYHTRRVKPFLFGYYNTE